MDNVNNEVVAFYKQLGFTLIEIKSSVFRIEESTLVFQTDHKDHTVDASTILYKDAEKIFTQALQAQRDAGAEEERVFVFQPQWVNEDPAWLCILTKGNEVLVEKVFTKTELSSAYRKKTGQYASTVITTYETDIGVSYLLKALTPPTK